MKGSVEEDEDVKRLEAVIGNLQLDWEIDYVTDQSTVSIREDMSKRSED